MYQNIYIIISADIVNVMYGYIIMYSLLLSGIVFSAIIFSNQSAYAHTFSEDENALYLTMIKYKPNYKMYETICSITII
jgi:hypothetical protein